MKAIRMRLTILGLCSLLLVLSGRADALPSSMLHPNVMRGIGDVSHGFTVDRVDMFNGNLRVEIPLGQAYPVTPRFSYRLVLTHNSNAWDLAPAAQGGVTAQPMAHSNAGFGWDLSLGRLVEPGAPGNTVARWIYVDPAGRPHPFHQRLHVDIFDEVPDVFYSRDGDYLRLRRVSPDTVLVEQPDGLVRSFAFDAGLNAWRLSRIDDPFGNHVSIAYGADRWTITDSHGRTHRVLFQADPAGHYAGVVDRVELAAFGGTTATYELSYGTGSAKRDHAAGDTDPATSTYVHVPLLDSVTLPDGSSYLLEYGSVGQRLHVLTLPTLGRIAWTYRTYTFQLGSCTSGSLPALLRKNVGVGARTTYLASGELEGSWLLSAWLTGTEPAPGCSPYLGTRVVTPLGDDFRYFFMVDTVSVQRDLYGLPFRTSHAASAGQFLSRHVYDCEPGGGTCALARQTFARYYQDAAGTSQSDPEDPLFAYRNRRLQSSRTAYLDDPHPSGGFYYREVVHSDYDGLGHFRTTETGGNFGQGDYSRRTIRYTAASGSYPGPSWAKPAPTARWILGAYDQTRVSDGTEERVVDFCMDPEKGVMTRKRVRASATKPEPNDVVIDYGHDAGGTRSDERYYGGDVQGVETSPELCSMPLPPSNMYRVRHESQFGVPSRTWYVGSSVGFYSLDLSIDRNTGLPSVRRDVSGSETVLTYDAMGRLTWEMPQGSNEAWIHHLHHAATGSALEGSQRMERLVFPNGQTTGVPLSHSTTYSDAFGRPAGERVSIESSTTGLRLQSHDGLGNLVSATEGLAGDFASADSGRVQYGDYDPFGRARTITHADGTFETFEFLGERKMMHSFQRGYFYNQTGVVQKEQVVETLLDRHGRVSSVATTKYVGQDFDWQPITTTLEYRYGVGREGTAVIEGGLTTTSRKYDGRGYLVETDNRFLSGPGRLITTFENYGPLGMAHSKTTIHRRYASPNYDEVVRAEYLFDRAGRVITVRDPDATQVVWREFKYGTANEVDGSGQVDFRKGRLTEAVRHHWERAADSPGQWHYYDNVRQTYSYEQGGRAARLETRIAGNLSGWTGASYGQNHTYDAIGRMLRWSFDSGQGEPGYTLDYTYDGDTLESVTGIGTNQHGQLVNQHWIVAIDHAADGLAAEVERGNGVVEVVSDDGTALPRPGRVRLEGIERWDDATGWIDYTWDSGRFQYDGRGVTVRRGQDYFVPPEWVVAPASTDVPPKHPCWREYVDGDDLRYSAWANEYCNARDPVWSYDHLGQVVAARDSRGWSHTIRDLQGRIVWQRTPFTEQWSSGQTASGDFYEFYVYEPDGGRLGEVRRQRFHERPRYTPPDEITYRYHHTDSPVTTDAGGRWINDPEQ